MGRPVVVSVAVCAPRFRYETAALDLIVLAACERAVHARDSGVLMYRDANSRKKVRFHLYCIFIAALVSSTYKHVTHARHDGALGHGRPTPWPPTPTAVPLAVARARRCQQMVLVGETGSRAEKAWAVLEAPPEAQQQAAVGPPSGGLPPSPSSPARPWRERRAGAAGVELPRLAPMAPLKRAILVLSLPPPG